MGSAQERDHMLRCCLEPTPTEDLGNPVSFIEEQKLLPVQGKILTKAKLLATLAERTFSRKQAEKNCASQSIITDLH